MIASESERQRDQGSQAGEAGAEARRPVEEPGPLAGCGDAVRARPSSAAGPPSDRAAIAVGPPVGRERVAGLDDPARVVHDDGRTVRRLLDAADGVDGVVGLEQRQELEGTGLEDDDPDGGPVVEQQAVGPKVDDQATDPDGPADQRGQIDQVRVRRFPRARARRDPATIEPAESPVAAPGGSRTRPAAERGAQHPQVGGRTEA